MYTSDTKKNHRTPASSSAKLALIYLLVSVFCAVFGAVYELFSHEVYSYRMIYAFAYPLIGGALPYLVQSIVQRPRREITISGKLYNSGIAALTVGSILGGVLDIYGTTNRLLTAYPVVGITFAASGAALYLYQNYISGMRDPRRAKDRQE